MKGLFPLRRRSPEPRVIHRVHSTLLNLGCGHRAHPDWVNVDIAPVSKDVLQHDLRQPLPFPAATFEAVYHSHVLEHLPRRAAPLFLAECFRVLRSGGTMRVAVPDLEMIARLYLKCLEAAVKDEPGAADRYEWMMLELLDQMVREQSGGEMKHFWSRDPMPARDFVIERFGCEVLAALEHLRRQPLPARPPDPSPAEIRKFNDSGEQHKWMYDRYALSVLLGGAGFVDFKVCAANQSRIPGFNRYLLDINEDGAVRKPDSLFVEAVKP